MKKFALITISLTSIATLIGVIFYKSTLKTQSTSKLTVATSLPLVKQLVEKIGRGEVVVSSIITGPSCNHEFEPTSGNLKQVAGAHVFVKVGLDFDLWVEKLVKTAAGTDAIIIDASTGVTPVEEKHGDDPDAEINPHYWGNPDNVRIMAKNILVGLIKVKPAKKAYFTQNYQTFINELEQTVTKLKLQVAELTDKRLVSYSAAFPYFYQYFGFQNIVTVETTCEQEISPKHLAEVVNIIKREQIKVVVGESIYPKPPRSLADETSTQVVLLWPATNDSEDYLSTITENVNKIVTALK